MLPEFVTETKTSWDFLRKSRLPIFLYGMGDGAEKIMSVFKCKNIPCAGFFASDEFVRGQEFMGYKVHSLSEVEKAVDEFIIVLAFGAGYRSLYDKITEISKRHILLAPDVPVFGNGLFDLDFVKENSDKFTKVYDLLSDEKSRKTYADVINAKISGKISFLDRCTENKDNIFKDILRPEKDETYIDMGAYNGDTVLEYANLTDCSYGKIYAVEPDSRNFKKLLKNTEALPRIECINAAAWSECTVLSFSDKSGRQSSLDPMKKQRIKEVKAVTGDSICENASYIKMDVEGAEHEAVLGCEKSLRKGAKLAAALYHRNEDMFDIPLLVNSINPRYRMYVRHELYIPSWETNLYCV